MKLDEGKILTKGAPDMGGSQESNRSTLVALVGAPNSGKTTLYNWLTNSQFKTVNYPGATIEYSIGRLADHLDAASDWKVMDTPGTYSLFPKGADEEVTLKSLFENPNHGVVGKVLVVVDGTQLQRQLALAQQIRRCGFSMILVVTMSDLLREKNIPLDLKILSEEFQCPVLGFEGVLGGGLREIVEAIKILPEPKKVERPFRLTDCEIEVQQKKMGSLTARVLGKNEDVEKRLADIQKRTQQLDSVLLHPFWGPLSFFVFMSFLFTSVFWLAAPLMDFIDQGFGFLIEAVGNETALREFFSQGILAGMGSVLVFVPQIFILFVGISFLEGSGYLARAATLIDRPLSLLGMGGRSFVPLLSGFACAVPALMAARNIPSKRDRWITQFVIPLMSCSARLPVYALLLGFLFMDEPAWKAGLAMAFLYFGALFVGGVAASIVHRLLPQDKHSLFMMELPLYRRPQLRVFLKQSLDRTWAYVKRAGPPIFVFAVLIWVGTNFPKVSSDDPGEQLVQSYLGQAGKVVEPIFSPMGVDWRVGVGLLSAFAAREVFVSSLATVFHITAEDEEGQIASLLKTMKEATLESGQPLFTVASISALLIFFMIALQCMSTFAVAMKESDSKKFAWVQLIVFNVVAYVLAVSVYQGLSTLGL